MRSGALGFEAASRGAARVVMVDSDAERGLGMPREPKLAVAPLAGSAR